MRLTKETPKRLMKLTKKATKEENRLKIKQLEHIRSKRRHETNTKKRGRWSAMGLGKNGLRSLWIVENMFLSFLESKILLWKVNFHIYFPQWQVMSKVSVKPWLLIATSSRWSSQEDKMKTNDQNVLTCIKKSLSLVSPFPSIKKWPKYNWEVIW